MIFKYYGVDWALAAFIVAHLWLLGDKRRAAFPVAVVACLLGVVLGVLIESVASVLMNVAFAAMHARAYFKWSPARGGIDLKERTG